MTALPDDVRCAIYAAAARTGQIPQADEIARALHRSLDDTTAAIKQLAAGRVLVLAPNDGQIWAAEPFCATPTNFRIESGGITYWALCIWDALGVPSALRRDATVHTSCGDCGERMSMAIVDGQLQAPESIVHFGVPARRFWDNLAFT